MKDSPPSCQQSKSRFFFSLLNFYFITNANFKNQFPQLPKKNPLVILTFNIIYAADITNEILECYLSITKKKPLNIS